MSNDRGSPSLIPVPAAASILKPAGYLIPFYFKISSNLSAMFLYFLISILSSSLLAIRIRFGPF